MSERKFQQGRRFEGIASLTHWLDAGYWVYWRERPKHPSFIIGMPFRVVLSAMRDGTLRRAIETSPPGA